MKMTYHYHDMEDYINYHDMTIILHITIAYVYMYVHMCISGTAMACKATLKSAK